MYKWLTLSLKTRKDEIIYRKAQRHRALSMRDGLIQKEQERQVRQEQELSEAEAKFNEEHKEEIDAVHKWEADQEAKANGGGADEYGDEDDDDNNTSAVKTARTEVKPDMPVFKRDEFLKRWLEDNPVIEIPLEQSPENDTDWLLTEEEEQALIAGFNKDKGE